MDSGKERREGNQKSICRTMTECLRFMGVGANMGKQPFNAFLSGFSATVGQFVLTASLRIQTNVENKADFASVSQERYIYCAQATFLRTC
jgi:hypothetical protein